MDLTIALILLQDGVMNGAIYALLGLALVLVFVVTRVIFIPQGEFVTFGALTLAFLSNGKTPGTVYLLMLLGVLVFAVELAAAWRGPPPGPWRCRPRSMAWRRWRPIRTRRCGCACCSRWRWSSPWGR